MRGMALERKSRIALVGCSKSVADDGLLSSLVERVHFGRRIIGIGSLNRGSSFAGPISVLCCAGSQDRNRLKDGSAISSTATQ
jgi:hypothetical protein